MYLLNEEGIPPHKSRGGGVYVCTHISLSRAFRGLHQCLHTRQPFTCMQGSTAMSAQPSTCLQRGTSMSADTLAYHVYIGHTRQPITCTQGVQQCLHSRQPITCMQGGTAMPAHTSAYHVYAHTSTYHVWVYINVCRHVSLSCVCRAHTSAYRVYAGGYSNA